MAFKLRKPPSLTPKHDAYPYQLDAARAVKSLSYAAIFHEQGLGKTKIAIDIVLQWLGEDIVDTVFIVAKKTLVQNWQDELKSHSHVTPHILSGNRGRNSIALNSPVQIYIMNYEVVATNQSLIHDFLATCRVGVILDESQKIKNPESKLAICFHSLSNDFVRRIIMTGTPVANRPYDIWSQIKFLDDGETFEDSFADFKNKLELPPNLDDISQYGEKLVEVMNQIKHFSIRQTKATAGIELPDKTIQTHTVELAAKQAKIYAAYRDEMAYEITTNGRMVVDDAEDILKRLLRLVQCASNPALVDSSYDEEPAKYTKLLELLETHNIQSNKMIVWSGFINNIEWLSKELAHYKPQKIHGSIPIIERNESIRKFKTDDSCRILLATPGAAKEGLTLTVANHAIFYDRGFSLDDYLQAQDRIHRISQTEACFVHNLIAQNTIDEWVDSLLHAKYQAAQLTQGDISAEDFNVAFNCDLSEALTQILSPVLKT